LDAVNRCVKKLTEAQQALVTAKYFERLSIVEIAARFGYSQAAAVSLLYRIRHVLGVCVQSALKQEDA
jgi:DNA-directed RNA polymerase specialized sigma24 family protein